MTKAFIRWETIVKSFASKKKKMQGSKWIQEETKDSRQTKEELKW